MKQFDADISKYDIVKQQNSCVIDPKNVEMFLKAKNAFNGGSRNVNTQFSINSVTKHFGTHNGNFVDMVAVDYDVIIADDQNNGNCVFKSNKTMVFSDFDTQSLTDVCTKSEDDKLWQAYRLFCDGGNYALRLEEFKKSNGEFQTDLDKQVFEAELLKKFVWIKNFVKQENNKALQGKKDDSLIVDAIPKDFDYSLVVSNQKNGNIKTA